MHHITLLVEIDSHEGRTERFRAAVDELLESVKANEPGALRYDFYSSDDGRRGWNVEVFADSAAVAHHMENVGPLLPKLLATVEFPRIEVQGDLSPEAFTWDPSSRRSTS